MVGFVSNGRWWVPNVWSNLFENFLCSVFFQRFIFVGCLPFFLKLFLKRLVIFPCDHTLPRGSYWGKISFFFDWFSLVKFGVPLVHQCETWIFYLLFCIKRARLIESLWNFFCGVLLWCKFFWYFFGPVKVVFWVSDFFFRYEATLQKRPK